MLRFTKNPASILAFPALCLCVFAMTAKAQSLEVTTSNYSLTFPNGWSRMSLGQPDTSIVTLTQASSSSFAITAGVAHPGALTQKDIDSSLSEQSGGDSIEIVTQGTKTLGGRDFNYLEYKMKGAAATDPHTRVYLETQNGFLFEAILIYHPTAGTAAITDVESALATLRITFGSPVLRARKRATLAPRLASLDLLGRTYGPSIGRLAGTPLFLRP